MPGVWRCNAPELMDMRRRANIAVKRMNKKTVYSTLELPGTAGPTRFILTSDARSCLRNRLQGKSSNVTAQSRNNLYVDIQPQEDKAQISLHSRPGLELFLSLGDEPIRGALAVGSSCS